MCGGGGRGGGGAGWQRVGPRRQRSNAGTDRFRLVAYVLQGFVAVQNVEIESILHLLPTNLCRCSIDYRCILTSAGTVTTSAGFG